MMDPNNYRYLQEQIRADSGIVLDDDKHYLLEARLLPIVRDQGMNTLDDLCFALRTDRGARLRRRVVEAMTTNETYFFREPAHFEVLRRMLIPRLMDVRKATRKIAIWSAAASTGQEGYSLAMLLLEMGLEDWNISITGTDLSSQVLERARSGHYSAMEINRGITPDLLARYFRPDGAGWVLKDHVKKLVSFEQIDLRANMRHLGPFDIVFCRNVLIYFDVETKRKIIDNIHQTLFVGGSLFLGASETGVQVGSRFKRQVLAEASFYESC